jgi:hypothetical protein
MGIAKRGLVPNLSVWIGLILDLLYDEDIGAAAEEQQNTTGISDTDVDAAEIPASRKHSRKPLPDHLDCEDEVLSSCDDCVDGGGSLCQIRENVELQRFTLTDGGGRSTALLGVLADHIGNLVRAGPALLPMTGPSRCRSKAKRKQRTFGTMCAMNAHGVGKRWPAWCMSAASSTMSPNRAARLSPKKPLSGLARVMK